MHLLDGIQSKNKFGPGESTQLTRVGSSRVELKKGHFNLARPTIC